MATQAVSIAEPVAEMAAGLYLELDELQRFGSDPVLMVARACRRIRRTVSLCERSGAPEDDENNAEHSFVLALAVYDHIQKHHPDLDPLRGVLMALVHDAVEVFFRSGRDICIRNTELRPYKQLLETEALNRLEGLFSACPDLYVLAQEYAHKETKPALVVSALEAYIAMEEILLSGGHIWRRYGDSFESILESQMRKAFRDVAVVPKMRRLMYRVGENWEQFTGVPLENAVQVVDSCIARLEQELSRQVPSIAQGWAGPGPLVGEQLSFQETGLHAV